MVEQIKEKAENSCRGCFFCRVTINFSLACVKGFKKEKNCVGIIYSLRKKKK